jgi:iron complex transport system substrate-binding protein
LPALFARKSVAPRPTFSWGFFIGETTAMKNGSKARLKKQKTERSILFCAGNFLVPVLFVLLLAVQGSLPASMAASQAGPSANESAARPFTDDAGRRVNVPRKVDRIVSLAPNLTEILFALSESEKIAGDTDYCDYPPEAARKPHIGGPINPNLEEIVKLRPDLILATSINRRETVDALDRLGLAVYILDPHSVDEMIASVERLGTVLADEKPAASLALNLRGRLAELDRRLAGVAPRRALFVVWTAPLISVGKDTFIADALRRAGAASIVDTDAEWPHVNLEEVVRLQPDVLIFASAHARDSEHETEHDVDALRASPGWRDLEAMRRGNIVIVSDAINRPAPRLVDAVEQLARSLHPEAFSAPSQAASSSADVEEACACVR